MQLYDTLKLCMSAPVCSGSMRLSVQPSPFNPLVKNVVMLLM